MIFETLHESAERDELILIDGGYCRWHRRRDGVTVIYEILSLRPGAGREMLERLERPILAKCPIDLAANVWYSKRGFVLIATEQTKSKRILNVWRLDANHTE